MMDYKLQLNGDVIRLVDDARIPNAPGNADWKRYLLWVADGGVPIPADPAPPVQPNKDVQLDGALAVSFDLIDSANTIAELKVGLNSLRNAMLGASGVARR